MHIKKNVAATHKLSVYVELRDGRPFRVLFDSYRGAPRLASGSLSGKTASTLPQFCILEYIEGRKLLWIYALPAQDLNGGSGEATLGQFRCALHEQHHRF